MLNKIIRQLVAIITICSFNIYCQEIDSVLDKLSESSDIIVIGEVQSIESKWDKDHLRIWSFVKIKCEENIKGNATKEDLIIRVLGGNVGEITMKVTDMPEFNSKERYLCFLQKDTDSTYAVSDWEAGKFINEDGFWQNRFRKYSNSFIEQQKVRLSK